MEEIRGIFSRKIIQRKIFRNDSIGNPFSFFNANDGSHIQRIRDDTFEQIERKTFHIVFERSKIQFHRHVQIGVARFCVDFGKGNLQNAYGNFFIRYRQHSARLLMKYDFGKSTRLPFGEENGLCRSARQCKRRKIDGVPLVAFAFLVKHDVAQLTVRLRFQIGKIFASIRRRERFLLVYRLT